MRKVQPQSMKQMYGEMSKPSASQHPKISVPLHALPEAKDWKVGKHYDVKMRLKQTGLNLNKGEGGDNGHAHFDLVGIQPHGKVRVRKGGAAKPASRYSRMAKGKPDAEDVAEGGGEDE